MKCPFCNAPDTRVIDSRPADENATIRRRRQCERCGKRFTTYEKPETMPLMIIKKDNSREAYDRAKRPISSAQITAMADAVETALFNREEREIPSTVIGEMVMEQLKKVDPVAYVRFASVYREFEDVNTFMAEINKLISQKEQA